MNLRALLTVVLLGLASGVAAQTIERALMPGQVITGHAKYEEDCDKCHRRFDKGAQVQLCQDCHKDVGKDVRDKRGLHGHLEDPACRTCHTDHKGRNASIIVLDKDKFDHGRTGYELKGAHKKPKEKCAGCHVAKKKYREVPKDCYSCHRKKDSHKGGLGDKCDKCHNETKWKDAKFDHDKTKFPLEGEHAAAPCEDCHAEGRYKDTPKDCYSCHKEDDEQDGHKGRFGKKCSTCHGTLGWEQTFFDHGRDAKFVLKGKHLAAACTSCHKQPLYGEKLPSKCNACHKEDDYKTGHKGSLGEKCESCHNEQGWKKTAFDHDKDTKYPLEGKHRTTRCDACHKGRPAPGTTKDKDRAPMQCIACHRDDDKKKGHKASYGEKCETCHNADEWKKTKFDHTRDSRTHFELKGKHKEIKCADCHKGHLYNDKLAVECYNCHRKHDDEKGHKGQLGKACENCHGQKDWKVPDFNHNKSRFPLTGGHVGVECKKCHLTPAFRDAPRKCDGCHQKDDVHKGLLGSRCESCHNVRTWKSWVFDHNLTQYPLRGAHVKVGCYDCHKAPADGTAKIGTACILCHEANDAHRGGFGGSCDRCHAVDSWKKVRR